MEEDLIQAVDWNAEAGKYSLKEIDSGIFV